MDRSLDEILAERKKSGSRGGRGRGPRNTTSNHNSGGGGGGGGARRRDRRDDYPRDGVRKVRYMVIGEHDDEVQGGQWAAANLGGTKPLFFRPARLCLQSYREEPQKIDEEWVHDRYDDNDADPRPKAPRAGRLSPDRASQPRGTRVRVDNLHYELTKSEIEGLFRQMGTVLGVELLYDRAGRSEGVAYVTYEFADDAKAAIREFDGANAKGQPIHLTIVAAGRRNPFEAAVKPGSGRPLAERITRPRRTRGGDDDEEGDDNGNGGLESVAEAAARGIDRGNRRPRKTQEELDAEMADYFGGGGGGGGVAEAVAEAGSMPAASRDDGDDAEMIG
ncbi:RNA-binding protein [Niveomyces insectorum RCEF 264]|uniref:RNA-binding protein n=1 Tax=Niveomyces insectorum RCEF 264 TaxID=1081102 RepID=A0A167ZTU6_9HYPO|nr:RNA-binding protein [Niveomyces insectorum RCEF 264]